MLKNYFKIAIAVLQRRKFFTFISLFGISFTLTILMVLTAFMDNFITPTYPDMKRDRSLYIKNVELRNDKGWVNSSSPSFYFLSHYAGRMKLPEKMALASTAGSSNAYVNNKKIVMDLRYTNAEFWEVAEFKFLEGKAYDKAQIDQSQRIAVISDRTKAAYFGADGKCGR